MFKIRRQYFCQVQKLLSDHKVVLFMKGEPTLPECGYSQLAVEILKFYKVKDYKSINILEEAELREKVKEHAQWPTFPQLFVFGELVGGSDILLEMHKEGSLVDLADKINSDQSAQE